MCHHGQLRNTKAARDTIGVPASKDHEITDAAPEEEQNEDEATVLDGQTAPAVVAVVVASDPGDWFDDTLESLAAVDYESFAVLVVNNGGEEDITERIAETLPTAFVKHLGGDRGFSAAANEALSTIQGAAFYLIVHDDVLIESHAVTEMVAEAFRSNAGIVGPKIVTWEDHEVLSSVGIRVDPFGFSSSIAEPDELDQAQHDQTRSVFAVSSACMLIRADLFQALGGFDADIPFFGENIDLCWRSHSAGASVSFCPSARIAHRERFSERRDVGDRQRLELRHETRTMLKNYSARRLALVLPAAWLLSIIDLVGSALSGQVERSGDIVSAWMWNLFHLPSTLRARRSVRATRTVRDSSYVGLMRQGSSRMRTLIRGTDGERRLQKLTESGRSYLREATSRSRRSGLLLGLATLVILAYGTRGLIFGDIQAVREIQRLGDSGGNLLGEWFSGWRESGLGEPGVAPGIIPASGMLSWILLGSVSAARRLLILGPVLMGAVGAWKLLGRHNSLAARAAVVTAYSLNPVVLGAVGGGRLGALVAYAVAPWLLRRVAAGSGVAPFASDDPSVPGSFARHGFWRIAGGSGIMLALVAMTSPLAALVLIAALLVLAVVVTVMADQPGGLAMLRAIGVASIGSICVAIPWLYSGLRNGDIYSLTGLFPTLSRSPSAAQIITGSVGFTRSGLLGWGMILAASFVLVAARRERLAWGVAAWILAVGSWAGAIALATAGYFGGAGLELVLVPAALALSLALGVGVLAFEEDVLGTDFGAGQLLAGVAGLALVVAMVPVAVAATDGRWYQPTGDFGSVLSQVDNGSDFRTLWIGDPDNLPVSGWMVGETGLALGTSIGLNPTLSSQFRNGGGPGIQMLSDAVEAAANGRTSRLGRVLGPMGIRYVIVVDRPSPLPFSRQRTPMPAPLVSALGSQLDLTSIDVNPAMATFKVDEQWPLRSLVGPAAFLQQGAGTESGTSAAPNTVENVDVDSNSLRGQLWFDAAVPTAILGKGSGTRFSGRVPVSGAIVQSVAADPGWTARTDSTTLPRSDFRGWAQSFEIGDQPGSKSTTAVTLAWRAPLSTRFLQLVQIASISALLAMTLIGSRNPLQVAGGPREPSDEPSNKLIIGVADLDVVDPADDTADPVDGTSDLVDGMADQGVDDTDLDFGGPIDD